MNWKINKQGWGIWVIVLVSIFFWSKQYFKKQTQNGKIKNCNPRPFILSFFDKNSVNIISKFNNICIWKSDWDGAVQIQVGKYLLKGINKDTSATSIDFALVSLFLTLNSCLLLLINIRLMLRSYPSRRLPAQR